MASGRRAVLLAAALAATGFLVGCVGPGPRTAEVSSDHRDALDELYSDRLFDGPPPGAGESLGEEFSTECFEGTKPTGGGTWVLLDDGVDAVAYYKALGEDAGWTVMEEHVPEPEAKREDQRSSLEMEKTSGGYTFRFSVLIGRSILHDEVGIGAHGSVVSPDVCR